jgi:dienelactone hydrolase
MKTIAWLAATRLDPGAAVGYYGGHIVHFAHGFNCDDRPRYNCSAAKQARQRSLEFLQKHLGK